MLFYLRTSLFESPAQTLVNTVNTEGVMGKGIAKTFKAQYPDMYEAYRRLCETGEMTTGRLMLWRTDTKWILNFPTKTTWRLPSKLEYIKGGLKKFIGVYEEFGITSISFPPLGCGNGNLQWKDVRPLMEEYLKPLPIDVYIHDRQVDSDFVPEHLESKSARLPNDFSDFLSDIRALLDQSESRLKTLATRNSFHAAISEEGDIVVTSSERKSTIPREELENVWAGLQSGMVTADQFGDDASKRYKSYLFGVLAGLPYVRTAEVQHIRRGNTATGYALFFATPELSESDATQRASDNQGELWRYLKQPRKNTPKNGQRD